MHDLMYGWQGYFAERAMPTALFFFLLQLLSLMFAGGIVNRGQTSANITRANKDAKI